MPTTAGELPGLLTATQVAELFRVDIKTVMRWARNGDLTSFLIPGGRRWFPRTDIDHYLNTDQKTR